MPLEAGALLKRLGVPATHCLELVSGHPTADSAGLHPKAGSLRGFTYSMRETLIATFTKPFTSRIQTRKTSQPPRNQASVPEATLCCTDFRRSMHWWEGTPSA